MNICSSISCVDPLELTCYSAFMERKLSRREINSIKKRESLLEAGLKLFQHPGYDQSDIRSICKEASVGLGTYYNYFSSKLDLYLALFEREFRTIAAQMVPHSGDISLKELIPCLINNHLKAHIHTPLFYREAELLIAREPQVRALDEALRKEVLHYLHLFIESQQDARPVSPVRMAVIYNSVEENVHRILCEPEEVQKEYIEEMSTMVYLLLTC